MAKRTITKAIREHYDRVSQLGCAVTGSSLVTLHHVHGGSVSERLSEMGLSPVKGMGMRGHSDWLVIPLIAQLHCVGPHAIDGGMGVRSWEATYGRQADFVDAVGKRLGYSLWERHQEWLDR